MPNNIHINSSLRMKRWCRSMMLVSTLVLCAFSLKAHATQIQDMATLKGDVAGELQGIGLVIGLNGTGDGDRFVTAQRGLAEMVKALAGQDGTLPAELEDARNVAIVQVSAQLPRKGAVEGERIKVVVSSLGRAASLKGGKLFVVPLMSPIPTGPRIPMAYAAGQVVIEDEENPTAGIINQGATLTRDFSPQFIDGSGRITLVLNTPNAGWTMSSLIASLVNSELTDDPTRPIAIALSPRTIMIQVPQAELQNPRGLGSFISRVMSINIPTDVIRTEAKVVINRKTQTIVITGDVQLSPVIITHKDMTITTVTPEPVPNAQNPREDNSNFLLMAQDSIDDPRKANLEDLIKAFDQLDVNAQSRIEIIEEIHKSGKLHGQLIYED